MATPCPYTYIQLQDHLMNKFSPLILNLSKQNQEIMERDDIEQTARLLIFKLWQKADEDAPDADGEPMRLIDLSKAESYLGGTLRSRVLDDIHRHYSPIRVPQRRRTLFERIQGKAKQAGVHPRDICKTEGMCLEEFDRITAAVASQLSIHIGDYSAHDLYTYTDGIAYEAHEDWSDLIADTNAALVQQARSVLSREQDAVIEAHYWTLNHNDASHEAVAEILTEEDELLGRYTPGHVASLHETALEAMRIELDVDAEPDDSADYAWVNENFRKEKISRIMKDYLGK